MSSSVTLEKAEIIKPLKVVEAGKGKYRFMHMFEMRLFTNRGKFLWQVFPYYESNCGSIPWIGQKVLRVKSYDPENPLQNAFFFLHDDLYQKKGYGIFDREDSDAICRGGLREAGCSRFQASAIDFFLMLGAWGHWGDNAYKNAEHSSYLEFVR